MEEDCFLLNRNKHILPASRLLQIPGDILKPNAGQKGRRFILPHSQVMIHEPLISSGFGGSATSIEKTAQGILETKAELNKILAEHTGRSIDEINSATLGDNFMTSEEAVEFGICDEIRSIF